MNGQRTTEERISMWLEEEAMGQLPDRTFEATFDRTRSLRQRPGPSGWRSLPMSRPIPALIAVGAAAVLIAVGVNAFRPSQPSQVVGASSSPSTAPTPTVDSATPSPTPLYPLGLAIVGLDGHVRQQIQTPRDAWSPDLTSDGSWLVFVTHASSATQPFEILPTRPGSLGTFVTIDPSLKVRNFLEPAWSPDGTQFAFTATGLDDNVDIYVADSRATNQQFTNPQIRRLTSDPADDEFPAWSADGKTIFYDNAGATPLDASGFSPTQEIWKIPAAGGTPVRLTTKNEDPDYAPDVRSDGTVTWWRGGNIWTMDSQGRNQRPLAAVPDNLGFVPRWSPDGSKIAVLQYDPSQRASYDASIGLPEDWPLLKVEVVDLATGKVTAVGARVASHFNGVSWMPDGSALLINRYDAGG